MPHGEKPMSKVLNGIINADIRDSVPDRAPFEPSKAPEGAPNVVYIVLDDVGFSAMNCYGGPVDPPNIDRIAAAGYAAVPVHRRDHQAVVVDVSGEPYLDLERQAVAIARPGVVREQRDGQVSKAYRCRPARGVPAATHRRP
jgi:hypothetical protein